MIGSRSDGHTASSLATYGRPLRWWRFAGSSNPTSSWRSRRMPSLLNRPAVSRRGTERNVMEVRIDPGDIAQYPANAIVVNLFEGVTQPAGATGAIDQALNHAISRVIQ